MLPARYTRVVNINPTYMIWTICVEDRHKMAWYYTSSPFRFSLYESRESRGVAIFYNYGVTLINFIPLKAITNQIVKALTIVISEKKIF